LVFEDLGDKPEEDLDAYRQRIEQQWEGAEGLEGTYPFTIDRSVKAFRLNNFLHDLITPEHREVFLRDKEACMEQGGLSDEEKDMLRRLDWRAMIHYGVIFFMLEKLGAVV